MLLDISTLLFVYRATKCWYEICPKFFHFKPNIIYEDIIYLLLAEFLVRTVNYGPSFFPSIYGPSAKRAGHKSMEKNEDP